jgi:tetratricopeptide (TPR) repeat protein
MLMKKVMMMAMMFMASSMAFAGDSPALKAIMKAKTYEDAARLLGSSVTQLASDEEKAKAYNKLVDLAMDKVLAESKTMTEIETNAQLGIKKELKVDSMGFRDAFVNALAAAVECNKYDQLPNAKGKIAPKFAEKFIPRIWNERRPLLIFGDICRERNDYETCLKYWIPWLDSYAEPMFEAQDHAPEKEMVGQVSYLAAWMANSLKKTDLAIKYAKIAMDGKFRQDAERVLMSAMTANLKTHADSLGYIEKLKGMLAQEPENEFIFNNLYQFYGEMKDTRAQESLLDGVLARNPKNFLALANKGVFAHNNQDFDTSIDYLKRAIAVKQDNPMVYFFLGTSLCMKAQEINTDELKGEAKKTAETQKRELYKEAIQNFDRCKELDPNKEQVKWGYYRQNAYYNYYGPDSPEYKQADADFKN